VATQATAATGTLLKMTGTIVPEVTNLADIGMAFTMVDVSSHDSNGWSSSIPTLKRGKPITVEMSYIPSNATHQALFLAAQTRASTAFSVTLPTTGNPEWTFNAFVGDIGIPAVPVDGALPLRVILTPDGPMTFG
jgi:Phage tail tube protein, TTP